MCGVHDVAKYVFLPGDPKRSEKIASFFDECRKVAEFRGYVTYSGRIDNIPVSVTSTGMGCPSAAIAVEELANIGAEVFIRVGTTGALQRHINIGDIIVVTAAVRADGTTKAYVPIEYPAVADVNVVLALIETANKLGIKPHVGIVWTSDAFYSEKRECMNLWSKARILSVEMECSAIFTIASLRGLRSGAILAVDGNLLKGLKKGAFEPCEKTGEQDERVQKAIDQEIKIAIEAVKILEKRRKILLLKVSIARC